MPQSERPYTIHRGPVTVTLAVNLDGVEKLKKRARVSTDTEFAAVMGYDRGQLSRVLAGKAVPGPKFVAAAVRAFGWHSLKDLLVIVPTNSDTRRRGAA